MSNATSVTNAHKRKTLLRKLTDKKLLTKKLKSETGQKLKGVLHQVKAIFSFDARKLQVEYMEAAAALTTKSLSESSASAALQHKLRFEVQVFFNRVMRINKW